MEIRPARSSDAAFLAWVILTAGRAHVKRGIWEVILDAPEDKCLAFFQQLTITETPHLFHYSTFLVCEAFGRQAAALGGHDPKILGYSALREALPEVFRKLGMMPSPELMSGRPPKIVHCIPAEVEGAWIIDSVATVPDFRRKGMADRLLDEMIERGRQGGFRRSQINIYIGNTAAQRAYEKHGFTVLDEKRDPYFEANIGSPGMARLLRSL